MNHTERQQAAMREGNARKRDLLALVRGLVSELHRDRLRSTDVTLSSRIERELGIDSIGRTELAQRIERAFAVRLSSDVISEAETVGDLLDALAEAKPKEIRAGAEALLQPSLPPVQAASDARTLIDALDSQAELHPDRLHVTVLHDDLNVLGTMSYGELARAGRALAAGLIEHDIADGDRIGLMLPTSVDFFVGFAGILYAGAVPVPIYPPMQASQLENHLHRQAGILNNAGVRMLITTPNALQVARLLSGLIPSLKTIDTVANLSAEPGATRNPSDDAAVGLIQYTSGSTGDPKGVVLTHANLLSNIRAFGSAVEASSRDVVVSWLPLYHDMGLIGTWLGCLYYGAPLYAMSPISFLTRPESWLWAIHRYRGTISAAPNFAFELCLSKVDDHYLEGLDLSSLRMVANGAEPVNVETLRRFAERFRRYGFRSEAMTPMYGLAESAVALALPPLGRGPVVDRVDREALTARNVAEPATADDSHAIEIAASGQPLPDHEIRIVDEAGRELAERQEGRLEFRGPSATSGYFRNESKTRELFRDGWLDSGDRAYMARGDVFITGRIKDIIIRAGRQIYPQEVEDAVGAVPGIRKGRVAAFGTFDPAAGTERVVVLAETRESERHAKEALRERAQAAANDVLGAPPDEIALVRPGTVPKTSSGKIRRAAAKSLHETGKVKAPARTLYWQLLRLWLSGLGTRLMRLSRRFVDLLYAGWWWTVLGAGFVLGSLAVVGLPRLGWRWAAVRRLARGVFALTGMSLTTEGIERLPEGNAVAVFNHASYLDVLVLAAVLPGAPVFVAKKEFAGQLFAGTLLRRLGALFVERYDIAASLDDTAVVTVEARQGRILAFFPEGTFTRRAGLAAFYLGAFKVAAAANIPVYPGILRGTRSALRSGEWFPRRGPLSVEIGAPVMPEGTDFASVVRLRDTVRTAMLRRSGEPDLGDLAKPEPPAG